MRKTKTKWKAFFCVLALAALVISGAADRVDDLVFDMLYSGNPNTRLEAAETLGRYGGPRVVEPMIAALNETGAIETSGRIQERAAITLGESNDPRAVGPLIAALYKHESAWKVELAIAEALGKLNDTRAIDPLIDALETDGMFGYREDLVRVAIVKALANFSDPRIVEPLTYIAKNDEDPNVRVAAVEALWKIKAE